MLNVKRFIIHSFGCQMNALDSERIGDMLLAAGWEHAEKEAEADLVLFNTCCVRDSAEKRAIGRLTLLKPWKKQNPNRLLVLCGCIAQKDGADLLEKFPFLDIVIGTRDYPSLPALLERVAQTSERLAVTEHIDSQIPDIYIPRANKSLSAFVTVMYGCDNYCSYCIVPHVRGREVSREKKSIINEIRALAKSGVKETTLLGQNVNSYKDAESGADFADLLSGVNDISGIERIRFTTSHPKDVSPKLICAMANLEHVCEHFHLPAQSGADAVLNRMNRKYTRDDYLNLAARIRAEIPNVVLTTDLLVGFPGETNADFQETLKLCREVRWDAAFTFIYSVRPGTAAAEYSDNVPLEVKKERVAELIHLQEKISAEKNASLIGEILEVLVERASARNPRDLAGKDRGGRTVVFAGDAMLIGKIVPVRICRSTAHTLIGEISSSPAHQITTPDTQKVML